MAFVLRPTSPTRRSRSSSPLNTARPATPPPPPSWTAMNRWHTQVTLNEAGGGSSSNLSTGQGTFSARAAWPTWLALFDFPEMPEWFDEGLAAAQQKTPCSPDDRLTLTGFRAVALHCGSCHGERHRAQQQLPAAGERHQKPGVPRRGGGAQLRNRALLLPLSARSASCSAISIARISATGVDLDQQPASRRFANCWVPRRSKTSTATSAPGSVPAPWP